MLYGHKFILHALPPLLKKIIQVLGKAAFETQLVCALQIFYFLSSSKQVEGQESCMAAIAEECSTAPYTLRKAQHKHFKRMSHGNQSVFWPGQKMVNRLLEVSLQVLYAAVLRNFSNFSPRYYMKTYHPVLTVNYELGEKLAWIQRQQCRESDGTTHLEGELSSISCCWDLRTPQFLIIKHLLFKLILVGPLLYFIFCSQADL